jgi:hypothetical protein
LFAKTDSRTFQGSFPGEGGWNTVEKGEIRPWKEPDVWRNHSVKVKVDEWGNPTGWWARFVVYWTSIPTVKATK